MPQVTIYPSSNDERLIDALRQDLSEFGSATFIQAQPLPHSKGGGIPEVLGLTVTLLSTPAILRMIALLKEYIGRDRGIEFEYEQNGRKVRLKSADLSAEELGRLGDTLIKASMK